MSLRILEMCLASAARLVPAAMLVAKYAGLAFVCVVMAGVIILGSIFWDSKQRNA